MRGLKMCILKFKEKRKVVLSNFSHAKVGSFVQINDDWYVWGIYVKCWWKCIAFFFE